MESCERSDGEVGGGFGLEGGREGWGRMLGDLEGTDFEVGRVRDYFRGMVLGVEERGKVEDEIEKILYFAEVVWGVRREVLEMMRGVYEVYKERGGEGEGIN